jgi:hypothetical protein
MATTQEEVGLSEARVSKYQTERTDLKQQIQKYWVEQPKASVGICRVTRKDGLVQKDKYLIYREDIGWIQLNPIVGDHWFINIFIERSGNYSVDTHKILLDKKDRGIIDSMVKSWMNDPENKDFIARQRKWFSERPWEQLYGLTPIQAVAKLELMGW